MKVVVQRVLRAKVSDRKPQLMSMEKIRLYQKNKKEKEMIKQNALVLEEPKDSLGKKCPLTSAEKVRAYRQRQKNKQIVKLNSLDVEVPHNNFDKNNSEQSNTRLTPNADSSTKMDGLEVNSITKGLCLLVGLHKTDEKKDIDAMVQKILKLRLFDSNEKKWHCNVTDMDYEILSVSQFTLCYKLKGNKLDFHMAMPGNLAEPSYLYFLDTLRKHYDGSKIKDGAFGKQMEIELVNDGPVTVQLEFPDSEKCVLKNSNAFSEIHEK